MGSCSLCSASAASLSARREPASRSDGGGGRGPITAPPGRPVRRRTPHRVRDTVAGANQVASTTSIEVSPSRGSVSTGLPGSHPCPNITPSDGQHVALAVVSMPSAMSRAPMWPLNERSATTSARRARSESTAWMSERSTLMNSGRSSAMTRMLAWPAPASSTAIRKPRRAARRRSAAGGRGRGRARAR